MHTDNDKKDILVLVEGITQELDDTTATAGARYQFLSLHYKGAPVFANATKINVINSMQKL